MKISTGLVPTVRAQHAGGFLTDFATAEASHKAPRGTIVTTLYSKDEPVVEKKGYDFTYVTGVGHMPEGWLERREDRQGVPADAVVEVTPGPVKDSYRRRYEWFEVTVR